MKKSNNNKSDWGYCFAATGIIELDLLSLSPSKWAYVFGTLIPLKSEQDDGNGNKAIQNNRFFNGQTCVHRYV